jgi:TldD protein
MLTRRRLVQQSSTLLATAALTRRGPPVSSLFHSSAVLSDAVHDAGHATVDPGVVQALALKALDAAKAAGAMYADVRLTRTIGQTLQPAGLMPQLVDDMEHLGFSVRALVKGYWGFAATPYWTADEAVRVARAAAAQAKNGAAGPARLVEWGSVPVVTGTWRTPIQIDPFRLSLEERVDMLWSRLGTARRLVPRMALNRERLAIGGGNATCVRQEEALATSDGSYVTQTFYRSKGSFYLYTDLSDPRGIAFATGLEDSGRGWEMFAEAAVLDQIPALVAILDRPRVPIQNVEIGRKPVVYDAVTMARILEATLGRGTEVDRAMGYEANASGTSYLGPDPLALLGTPVAHAMVTVTADRSLPTGLATVRWDAEGVTPEAFPLIQGGTLVDYQTTREQAAWLAPWYAKRGLPMRSHGCAGAEDALGFTMQRLPNLSLAPASSGGSFEDLVSSVADGLVVERGEVQTDFQCKTGIITARIPQNGAAIYHVKNGKRVALVQNAGILFNALDLWKNVTALGNAASVLHVPGSETKGEPQQETPYTVSTPPAAFKEQAIIDIKRKA